MGGWRKTPVALLIISAIAAPGRTLMSAWIETKTGIPESGTNTCSSRTLMSAWIETKTAIKSKVMQISRTLMSAWIETIIRALQLLSYKVALS